MVMLSRLLVTSCALLSGFAQAEPVRYDWFEYTGHDAVFEQPLPPGHYRNPILSGFYPDPSITRAGDRFYLVHSTFAYFPGIPVFESRDLVHWRQIGSVIDRASQLDFSKLGVSRGVFAPSIEYRDGLFYVFNTLVDGGGNYVVTAKNPAGPWSDPTWLPELTGGIDPSMFVDDDGLAYVLNNGPPQGAPRYDGHRAIWIQEFDRATLKLRGPRKVLLDGGVEPGKQPVWIEGPHIYKRAGWYYLSCAEGGTGPQHSQVVLRARSPWGPFEPYAGNPILTQRDLPPDRSQPITNAGHADLVEAPDGTWWATFLATRTYEGVHYNTGRGTFLLPVTWRDGWPVILEHGKTIPYVVRGPRFMEARDQQPLSGNFTWRDEFDSATLDNNWLQLRARQSFDLKRTPGALSIDPQVTRLDDVATPAFLGRRQQHLVFDATTQLRVPAKGGTAAGLAAFQNETHWYFFGARRVGSSVEIFVEKKNGEHLETLATTTVPSSAQLKLRISGNARAYSFRYQDDGAWEALKENDDGSILSTDVAGGFVGAVVGPYAREEPAYRDLNLSFEARAADLVAHMTLEEKISQLGNNAPAIPRLGVPQYEWWNEALHGVARAGAATVFPQAIGLAATFDRDLMHEIATAISDEARAKHHEFARRGLRGRYQGLTFWSPNINIFRDPRWGRGQETYGEDPWLTARMGVAFVQGLQGDDPQYRKVDATAKHFAVHSGPEADRHHFDVHPSEQDLYDTYLPAFQALVQEGKVAAVMGAYNRVYGESASASTLLLQRTLRERWGFQGYVVSDCDSIEDIYQHHKIVSTAAQAAALGVSKGCDLDCGKTYEALLPAVQQGLIGDKEIDAAVQRLMLTRFRLGMFDPPERVRWAQIPYSVNQSAEHDRLARRAAQSSIVLLKNDGVLPLSRDIKTLAVVGPTADDVMSLLGNYYGTPAAPVTVLQGIRAAVGANTKVLYARGADLVEGREEPRAAPVIDAQYLRVVAGSAQQGLKGEYFRGRDFAGTPVMTRVDARVAFRWDRGAPTDDPVARGELTSASALAGDDFSVRWSGQLLPPESGRYELVVGANDGFRLFLDGRELLDGWQPNERLSSRSVTIDLEAGRAYDLRLEYFEDIRDAEVRLAWRRPGARPPFDEALDVARQADAIVFVGGLTGDVEGEEMKVSYPGFTGGDRTDLRLPASQQKLLEALRATGKPVVLVLTTGSALAIDWAQQHLPAILVAWYPGQRGGTAVADVLFGDVSPSGRLPVTFYKASEKLPPFDDYTMQGRTYRYFGGQALYPFGHGLSYSRFEYSGLKVDRSKVEANGKVTASLTVRNAGKRAADELVQLYVRAMDSKAARARKDLRGVTRVTLEPGESRQVTFEIDAAKDLRRYDSVAQDYVVDTERYEVQVGASSADIRQRTTFDVTNVR
jgi:beta-glucosidase